MLNCKINHEHYQATGDITKHLNSCTYDSFWFMCGVVQLHFSHFCSLYYQLHAIPAGILW